GPDTAYTDTLELPGRTHQPVGADSAAIGVFTEQGGRIILPTIALVTDQGRRVGYVVTWWRLTSSPSARTQFAALVGPGARFIIGSRTGVWTDQVDIVPGPPDAVLQHAEMTRWVRPDGAAVFARAGVVPGTPWI